MIITECPRDAMQGLSHFIPTWLKAEYLNILLKVGFDVLDFGSFVSPKAVPQMRDTAEVLSALDLSTTKTKLLAIIANVRGAEQAAGFEEITYVGFPFSVSETFQKRNTNSTIEQSLESVKQIQEICEKKNKKLLIYLSMAFGNPYGDVWNTEIVSGWADKIATLGVRYMALADTVGVSTKENIKPLFESLIKDYPGVEFGAHLHSNPASWRDKIEAAVEAGCTKFDTALRGFGGCPMAKDDLVGNIATENLLNYLKEKNINYQMDPFWYKKALEKSDQVFYDKIEANKIEQAS